MCKYCELKSEGAGKCENLFEKRGYIDSCSKLGRVLFKKPTIYGYIGYRTNRSKKEENVIPKIIVSFMEGSLKDNNWKEYGWHVDINYCPMCGRKLV